MLAKKFRLSRRQVNIVYRKGKSTSFGSISIKFYPNGLEFPRFSVIIPKSVVKKVVERNRLRRIIFEELGKNQKTGMGDCLIRLHRVIPEEILKAQIKKILAEECVK